MSRSNTHIIVDWNEKMKIPWWRRWFKAQRPQMSTVPRNYVIDPFWNPFEGILPYDSSILFPKPILSGETSAFTGETPAFTGARFDWKETPEAHVFKADLPGLKKEEINVEVEKGQDFHSQKGQVLQISGERKREKEEENGTWLHVERSSGSFLRRFRLPENANADDVRATMKNGVLTVTIPKEEVKKFEVKSIEISG